MDNDKNKGDKKKGAVRKIIKSLAKVAKNEGDKEIVAVRKIIKSLAEVATSSVEVHRQHVQTSNHSFADAFAVPMDMHFAQAPPSTPTHTPFAQHGRPGNSTTVSILPHKSTADTTSHSADEPNTVDLTTFGGMKSAELKKEKYTAKQNEEAQRKQNDKNKGDKEIVALRKIAKSIAERDKIELTKLKNAPATVIEKKKLDDKLDKKKVAGRGDYFVTDIPVYKHTLKNLNDTLRMHKARDEKHAHTTMLTKAQPFDNSTVQHHQGQITTNSEEAQRKQNDKNKGDKEIVAIRKIAKAIAERDKIELTKLKNAPATVIEKKKLDDKLDKKKVAGRGDYFVTDIPVYKHTLKNVNDTLRMHKARDEKHAHTAMLTNAQPFDNSTVQHHQGQITTNSESFAPTSHITPENNTPAQSIQQNLVPQPIAAVESPNDTEDSCDIGVLHPFLLQRLGNISHVELLHIGDYSIGSVPSNRIHLELPWVSKDHCTISVPDLTTATLTDKQSANGVYVNGVRQTSNAVQLVSGDIIGFGNNTRKKDIENDSCAVFRFRSLYTHSPFFLNFGNDTTTIRLRYGRSYIGRNPDHCDVIRFEASVAEHHCTIWVQDNEHVCIKAHHSTKVNNQDIISLNTIVPLMPNSFVTLLGSAEADTPLSFQLMSDEINYRGIVNQGATCYLNALLQMLYHIAPFREWIYTFDTSSMKNVEEKNDIVQLLKEVFCTLQIGDMPAETRIIPKLLSYTDVNEHQDCNEALNFLFNVLDEVSMNLELQPHFSPIPLIFGGTEQSTIQCVNVSNTSTTSVPFTTIAVSVATENSLEEALLQHTAVELMDDINKYNAGAVLGLQDATKTLKFTELPKVLIFNLKRFVADNGFEKLNKRFTFSNQLNMSQFSNHSHKHYTLFGIVSHSGTVLTGHYVSFIRPSLDAQWFKFDDTVVTPVTESIAINDNFGNDGIGLNAYMLFYVSHDDVEEIFRPIATTSIDIQLRMVVDTIKNDRLMAIERKRQIQQQKVAERSRQQQPNNQLNRSKQRKRKLDLQATLPDANEPRKKRRKRPRRPPRKRKKNKFAKRKPMQLGLRLEPCSHLHQPLADELKSDELRPFKKKETDDDYEPDVVAAKPVIEKKPVLKPKIKNAPTIIEDPPPPNKNKASKKKPVNHILIRNKKLADDEEIFTVVRGLSGFINPKLVNALKVNMNVKHKFDLDLGQRLEANVKVISGLTVEASLLIYFYFTRKLQNDPNSLDKKVPDFRNFFNALKQKSWEQHNHLTKEYFKVRNKYKEPTLYDCKNMTESVALAADAYKVNLANNIVTHMYDRVKNFFKAKNPKIRSYGTHHLFVPDSTKTPNPTLIRFLRDDLGFNQRFTNINNKWWTYIPFLYRLQQWRRAQSLHTFNIFPIMHHGRHHLQVDTTALYNIINRPLKVGSHENFKANSERYWRNLFNIGKLETENHKFYGSITTDGIMVSVRMRRKKKEPDPNRLDKLRKNFENEIYDQAIALDPGLVLSLAGIIQNLRTGEESAIRYHSNSIRYDIGEHRRARIYRRETNPFFIRLAADRNQLADQASAKSDPLIFLGHRLKHFTEWQNLLFQKKIAKHKFEKYIQKQRLINDLVKEIVGTGKKTIVFAGSTVIAPHIKGYVRAPNKAILKENRTTMLCSNCHQPATTSLSPHRWQHCKQCHITWNRDINAGRNILYVGRAILLHEEYDDGFKRTFRFKKNANGYKHQSAKPKPNTKRDTRKKWAEYRKEQRINKKITA